MSVTLDSTVSGQLSNSYVDLSYADSYWLDHYSNTKSAQWATLSPAQETRLLVLACASIERYKYVSGYLRPPGYWHSELDRNSGLVIQLNTDNQPLRAVYRQKLQFPRNLDYDVNGVFYIPEDIKIAQCEQALYLLNLDEDAMAQRLQGVRESSVSVGDISIKQQFDTGSTALSPISRELLSQFFFASNSWRRA